jgi:thiol-disulfide isomerase/thioredoxin
MRRRLKCSLKKRVALKDQRTQGSRMKYSLFFLGTMLCLSNTPSMAAGMTGPAVGSVAPDFKAHNLLTGETAPLSVQRGKVVILTFWASWCGPCRRELPNLEKAQRIIGKDRLTVLAVSFKEKPEASREIKKLASQWQINMIHDYNGSIAGRYAISAIPHLFIISRDGKVLANHIGYGDRSLDELVADINHAFAEPPAESDVAPPSAASP